MVKITVFRGTPGEGIGSFEGKGAWSASMREHRGGARYVRFDAGRREILKD